MAERSAEVRRLKIEQRIESGKQECGKCLRMLPLLDFSPAPSQPGGVDRWCRACRRGHRRALYEFHKQERAAAQYRPNVLGAMLLSCCSGWMSAPPPIGQGPVIVHHDAACWARNVRPRPRGDWRNGGL
jgi:hypothetical protein